RALPRAPAARDRGLGTLATTYPAEQPPGVRDRWETLAKLPGGLRMPLLLRLFPALGQRPESDRQRTVGLLDRVIAADGTITVSEYAFARLARLHLFEQVAPPGPVPKLPASQLESDLQVVLSVLAQAGHADGAAAAQAFDRGMAQVIAVPRARYQPPTTWVPAMNAALV